MDITGRVNSRFLSRSVNWATDPEKDQRLLDWLDKNPAEREALFSFGDNKVTGLTKNECGQRAAAAVFTYDADPALNLRFQKDPMYYRNAVLRHIGIRWRIKYTRFNEEIGPKASNMRYEDIESDGVLHRKIKKMMQNEFPAWSRLHFYWRTMPYYNKHFTSLKKAKTSTKPKIKPTEPAGRCTRVSAQVIEVEDSSVDSDSESMDDGRDSTASLQSLKAYSRTKRIELPRGESSTLPHKYRFNKHHDDIITAEQQHELRMAEIRLRQQELELQIQEKKNAAELQKAQAEAEERRQQGKHQIMMRLMAFMGERGDGDVDL